jgi:hypothetical protein
MTGDLGLAVWDTIADLTHRGETRLDPDSAEAIELRNTAYATVGIKTGGDPLLVSRRRLAYSVLEWVQGMARFDAVLAASEGYEKPRIKA